MITRALRAYRRGENLDTSEVLALTRVEQALVGAGHGPRDEAAQPGVLHGPPLLHLRSGKARLTGTWNPKRAPLPTPRQLTLNPGYPIPCGPG